MKRVVFLLPVLLTVLSGPVRGESGDTLRTDTSRWLRPSAYFAVRPDVWTGGADFFPVHQGLNAQISLSAMTGLGHHSPKGVGFGRDINLVYASLSQLQGRKLLSLDEPPMVLPVTIDGLSANADGLYRLADVDARFAEAMAEYDAIEDAATDVPSPARIVPISQGRSYTLGGMQANDSTRGVIVSDNQKVVKR